MNWEIIKNVPYSNWFFVAAWICTTVGATLAFFEAKAESRKTELKQDRLEGKQDKTLSGINEILARMKGFAERNASNFTNEFPYGYTLFGITGTKEIVPFSSGSKNRMEVDWAKAGITVMSGGRVTVMLPDLKTPNVTVKGVTVNMTGLKVGQDYLLPIDISSGPGPKVTIEGGMLGGDRPAIVINEPTAAVVLRLLEAQSGSIFVLGLRPYQNPPLTDEQKRVEQELRNDLYGPRWNPRTGKVETRGKPKGKTAEP